MEPPSPRRLIKRKRLVTKPEKNMRTVKIVATLGPATNTLETIQELIRAGVNVVRMNFSHGSYDDHARRIDLVRKIARKLEQPIAILQDLQGPKIRTGRLIEGGPVTLIAGETLRITTDDIEGTANRISTSYLDLPGDVKEDDRILLSDGLIELRVESSSDNEVTTRIVNGGTLNERQGINLPGVGVSAPALTEKDKLDLAFGLEHSVDFIALSFVRRAADVLELKSRIEATGKAVPVIAKLEKPEAIANIEEILDAADGAMVARGDLGVELSPEKVPLIQKRVIALANERGKPVITATQMLESMIENPRPTRAEASDVANAILDGSDALMLSGETAVGKHPIAAVRTMMRVAEELHDDRIEQPERRRTWTLSAVDSTPDAIGAAVSAIVRSHPNIDAIWVITQSGASARLISHYRQPVPIIAFTPNIDTYHRLALSWGVTPILTTLAESAEALEQNVGSAALRYGVAQPGDMVVITGSHPFNASAPTNFLRIQKV